MGNQVTCTMAHWRVGVSAWEGRTLPALLRLIHWHRARGPPIRQASEKSYPTGPQA